jgi:hypothetical protein
LRGDYEAIDSDSTLDLEATYSSEARDFEVIDSYSAMDLKQYTHLKQEILKEEILKEEIHV